MPQAQVAQAHVQQRLQLARNGGHVLEEGPGVFHRQLQHLRNVAALPLHLQCFAVVALAVAHVAGHVHVGQKMHFHFHHAIALAGFAAPAGHVERKAPRRVAALFGGGGFGHQLAQRREQAGVGRGVAARCAANGRLIDVDHLVEKFQSFQAEAGRGVGLGAVDVLGGRAVQRVVHQGGFARARYTRDASEQPHRNVHIHLAQVVPAGAAHAHGLQLHGRIGHRAPGRALCGHGNGAGARQKLPGDGGWHAAQMLPVALGQHLPAMHACAGAHVNHMVGGADHVFIVLDHDHAVAQVAQALQRGNQAVVVALVQADAGFVQHVHHAGEARANLAGQANALGFAAAQGFGTARQAQVAQAHVVEKVQAQHDFAHHFVGNFGLGALQAQLLEPLQRVGQRALADGVDAAGLRAFAQQHMARFGAQARALAHRAGLGVAQPRQGFAHRGGIGFAPAPLQVGQDALEGVLLDHGLPARAAAIAPVGKSNGLLARAVQHDVLYVCGQAVEGLLQVKVVVCGQALQLRHLARIAPIPARNGARSQAQAGKRQHARRVEHVLLAQAVAGWAGTRGGIEREQARL